MFGNIKNGTFNYDYFPGQLGKTTEPSVADLPTPEMGGAEAAAANVEEEEDNDVEEMQARLQALRS